MYPEQLTAPMRKELTDLGFADLATTADVDNFFADTSGTALLVVNSVCGCAAGSARPGIRLALNSGSPKPTKLATVFAGVDTDATAKARELTLPYPPSSPSMALFKDGKLVHFIERQFIEGRPASLIAQHLEGVFKEYCN